jgi:hypothetical protein
MGGMRSNTAVVRTGRLLEVRADAGYRNAAEVDSLFDEIDRQLAKLPPDVRHVTVADWRRCPLMAPEAAQRIGQRIANTNAHTERSAALANSESPVAVLQFVRLIRDAGLPDRKLFFDRNELVDWLSDVLTDAEIQRLKDFLDE